MKTLNLNVKGMTCTSCEVLIERKLKHVTGVHSVKVSRAKEEAIVDCDETVALGQLQEAIAEKGYTLTEKENGTYGEASGVFSNFFSKDKERWSEIGAVFVVLLGAYLLLNQFNLLPANMGVTENMSYGFVVVLGLVAGASTCFAVAGGLLLTVTAKFNEAYPHLSKQERFLPHLSFNAGRVASYAFFGGIIGAIGSALTLSETITGIISLAASALMVVVGLQLLGVFPWLNKLQVKTPKIFAHKVYDASGQAKPSQGKAFLFGAATFLLPCGFTQALQLYVLGKGDAVIGALTLLAFSIGTMPSLLSVGLFSSFAKGNTLRYFTTFSAVLVIALGLWNIPNGLTLTGASIGLPSIDLGGNSDPLENSGEAAVFAGESQVAELVVDGLDYFPSSFTVKVGVPVEWRIDGRKAQGCARVLTAPQLGIREVLPNNEIKVITFTPSAPGKIKFTCSMGMTGPGYFEVI